MPVYTITTVPVPLTIRRLSAALLSRTSPATPAADSRLVKEIAATVSANTKSDHLGALPRWIGSSSLSGLKNSARPRITMNACIARSAITSTPIRRARRPPRPRMLPTTTTAMKRRASISASSRSPSGLENTLRYWVAE